MINVLYLHAGAEMYGADKVLLELIKGLDKTKFTPYVILPCDGPLVRELQNEGVQTAIVPYPILRRKYFNPKGLLYYVAAYLRYSKVVYQMVQAKGISLLHINTTAVLEGIYLKGKLKVPVVWHVHEIILKPKMIYRFISMLLGKFSDQIVVVSDAVKRHLLASGKVKEEQIEIIYNGVNNQTFYPQNEIEYLRHELHIPEDARVIGMIGRVNAWKGQQDFLDAVAPILRENSNVYAVLVGGVFEGEEWRMEQLQEAVRKISGKDQIIVQDFRDDPANVHNLFDVFVLPSTNPDPLPTVVLEAMATGKPIVGYRHGGICEMVKDGYNGFLADVNNPKDLQGKLEILLSNRDVAATMGENSLERQKCLFSLEAYIKNFSAIYENLIRRE